MSNDKGKVLAVARNERQPESPTEIIKDPMVLEFLGLEKRPEYYERDFESAIISHIADFLLEMGKGPDRNGCSLRTMSISRILYSTIDCFAHLSS